MQIFDCTRTNAMLLITISFKDQLYLYYPGSKHKVSESETTILLTAITTSVPYVPFPPSEQFKWNLLHLILTIGSPPQPQVRNPQIMNLGVYIGYMLFSQQPPSREERKKERPYLYKVNKFSLGGRGGSQAFGSRDNPFHSPLRVHGFIININKHL